MPPRELLSEGERAAIRAAVVEVERQSGAELVPVLVERSDAYAAADWKGVAAGALVGVLAHLAAPGVVGWSRWAAWSPIACALVGAAAGFGAARLPPLRRALAGRRELDRRVDAGARDAFVELEIFRTLERTGLLLYVSLFEHRVRILADEGVYRAVAPAVWEQVARECADAMRGGPHASALLAAVRRAGELVAAHGPRRRRDDLNELPDSPSESGPGE